MGNNRSGPDFPVGLHGLREDATSPWVELHPLWEDFIMTVRTKAGAAVLAAMLAMLVPACNTAKSASPPAGLIPERTKEQKIELGKQHKTAAELYKALRDEAKGGQRLAWNGLPDWSGIYSRPLDKGFYFDTDQKEGEPTTAKLTPEFQAKLD